MNNHAAAAGLTGSNQTRSAPNPQMNKASRQGASSSSSTASANGPFRKGHWSVEEDIRLIQYVRKYGEGRWSKLAKAAGLQRCGKSCRLRWVNYLRPDIKRGHISEEEERLIIKLHSLLGNRWSLIAIHLPGRSDNEIKNYWRSHIKKKLKAMDQQLPASTHNMDSSSSGASQLDQEIGHCNNSFNASMSLMDATSCNFDMLSLEVSPTSSTHQVVPVASHITTSSDHDNYHQQDDMLLFNTINNLNHHFMINNNSNLPSSFSNYNMPTTSNSNAMSFNHHNMGVASNLSNNFGTQLSYERPSQLQVGEDIHKLLACDKMQGHEPPNHMQYGDPSNLLCNVIRGEKVDSYHCNREGEVWDQVNFGARQICTQQPIVPFSTNPNPQQGLSIPDSESVPWDVETVQPIVELENTPCQLAMDSNFNFELWDGEIFQMDVDQKLLREQKYHS